MTQASLSAHQFKGLSDWIEVFRAGTHTDSKGRGCTFTEADLDQMVSNLALGAAPAVLGHPKHNDPAYGWVKPEGAKREGASLFVKFEDVNPAFAASVDSGAYRNRSVSVFQDKDAGWRLRHVGWLGAAPPAIDGLAPLDYSAEVDAYEFDAEDWDVGYALSDTAELLRGLREQMIAKDGIEAADAALPNWRIQSIADAGERVKAAARTEVDDGLTPFSQHDNPGGSMSFTQEQLDAAAAKARKEAEDKAAAEFAASQTELTQLRSERQSERITTQIAGWTAGGVVTPAEVEGLAEFMASIEGAAGEFSFSAADKSDVKKTPAQFFADFMAKRKPVVKLGNQSNLGGNQGADLDMNDAGQIADRARQYMKEQTNKGLTVSLPEAVAHVSSRTA
ncbi:hypothetical protein [Rhodoferax aquaticus]|uniref:Peptidase n=1 Tax=Rhodoferax aquaticus TaxID=2527691 RepID=A0A515ETB8_9BURK|nr:hypothetical protein [Rhodoferax aquaticus]QDL55926.1 hypothetical protein EXZ61_18060 [Rhodoferax aquaticus]